MSHGVAATAGHLASNGGLRGHSVGDTFPWIVMQRGDRIGVLTPAGWFIPDLSSTWKSAELLASGMKEHNIRTPDCRTEEGDGFLFREWEYIGSK